MSNVNIRKITIDDKEDFLKMSKEFYSSDAVLSDIKPQYHENAFNLSLIHISEPTRH